jgi:hypothetical protein
MGRQRRGSVIDFAFRSPDDCSSSLAGAFAVLPIHRLPPSASINAWAGSREGLGFLHQTNPSWIPIPGSMLS